MSPKKTAVDASRSNVYNIEPERLTLITDKEHALYDPRVENDITEKMVISIIAHGVVEPLVVRKNGSSIEVVDGRQRTINAREANKRLAAEGRDTIKVPCIIRGGKDGEQASLGVELNEIRLSDDVLTKAEKAAHLRKIGRSEQEIAQAFGVTTKTIGTWAKFGELSASVLKAIKDDRISPYDAVSNFEGMSREEQNEALEKVVESSAKSGKKKGKKEKDEGGKGKESPVKRLRSFFRSETAMAALNEKERTLVAWFFGESSIGDLVSAIPRLATYAGERKSKKGKKAKKDQA